MGLWVRPRTTDAAVPGDIRAYAALDVEGCHVLDLGGNIGASVKLWMDHGAKRVTVVEPDPDNATLLRMNTERYGHSVEVIEAAVVRLPQVTADLYVNGRKGKDWHSTVPVRGRDVVKVKAITFQALLDVYQPDRLKVDIEGAEFEIFEQVLLPPSVKGIVMEVHLMKPQWRDVDGPALFEALKQEHGFTYIRKPNMTPAAWANTVIGLR